MVRHALRAFCIAALALTLAGCEPKLTRENYDRIEEGMTVAQVEAILGKGKEQDSGGFGITSAGIIDHSSSRRSSQRVFVWEEDGATVVITFTDGVVTSKRETGVQ